MSTDRLNTHYANAKIAFEVLKSEAKRTGKKVVSIAAVAKNAQLPDRKYLYGVIESPNKDMCKMFKKLGDEIKVFKRQLSQNTIEKIPITEAERFEEFKKNMITENTQLLRDRNRFKKQFETVVQQRDKAINTVTNLEARLYAAEAKSKEPSHTAVKDENVSIISRDPIIISPDIGLIVNGSYQYDDKNLRNVAWLNSMDELRKLLKSPIPTKLYITIGVQGSGKSRWTTSVECIGRREIIFDATNLTMYSRYELFHIAKSSPNNDLKICAVCFPVLLETALKRNAKRPADRRVPENVIKKAYSKIEFPTIEGDLSKEQFDEILIIRGDNE